MLLSNVTIRRRLEPKYAARAQLIIIGLQPNAIQPNSVDVHQGLGLKVWTGHWMDPRRPHNSQWWKPFPLQDYDGPNGPEQVWILQPNGFYLGVLQEWIQVPIDLCMFLSGCSTEARNGFIPHQEAGLFDAGWCGNGTTEVTVRLRNTILRPYDRVGQVYFIQLTEEADPPYGGRYQGDTEAQPARHAALAPSDGNVRGREVGSTVHLPPNREWETVRGSLEGGSPPRSVGPAWLPGIKGNDSD